MMNLINKLLNTAYAESGLSFSNTERHDPYKTFNYRVTISGKKNFAKAGFNTVTGLKATTEAVPYRDGNDPNLSIGQSAGLVTYDPVVLSRGMSEDTDLFDWFNLNVNTAGNSGQADHNMKCTVKIELMDRDRVVVKTWELIEAWPVEYELPELNATANEVAIDRLTIRHNGIRFTNGRAS
ncbi:T4-like virus tail tube protein gp19 [compost metagenome]